MFQSMLSLYNPWWNTPQWQVEGVRRELFNELLNSIEHNDFVTVMKGARQGGKTFLVRQCISALLRKGIPSQNIWYFLLDDPEMVRYIEESPGEFANFLRNEAQSRGKLFVFFDEFQKVAGITELVKIFYETGSNLKFVLTGSSSLLIAKKISESLLGRTETFILYPFSFKEFLAVTASSWPFTFSLETCSEPMWNFLKDPEAAFAALNEHYSQYHFAYQHFAAQPLRRYLLTGGYPQAALAQSSEHAFLRLKEIKQAYIEKDIVSLLRLEKLKEFDHCMRILALQSGSLIQYNELQSAVGINFPTLKQFLNVLEATYLWSPLRVFSTNKISSLKKRPKAYFNDLGSRNFLASTRDETQLEKEKGAIAENFVYLQLLKFNQYCLHGLANLFFWRSPDGNEVDFIFDSGGKILPIEVKFHQSQQMKIQPGFQIFLQKMGIKQAVVVSNQALERRQVGDCQVYIIPLVLWGAL
jgi:hypothetical protein